MGVPDSFQAAFHRTKHIQIHNQNVARGSQITPSIQPRLGCENHCAGTGPSKATSQGP